jgi:ACS family D-galactonate transporter-like MFS transporter
LSSAVTGWTSDHWVLTGRSPTLARKSFIIASCIGTAACLFIAMVATPVLAIVCLLATGLFFGFGTPMFWTVAQTLAGPRAAGQWMGIQNFFGNLAGIIVPVVTGFLVDRTGNFAWAFAVAGAISLIGAIAWGVVIPRIETLDWPSQVDGGLIVPHQVNEHARVGKHCG